ncbi:predicted protein [Botrytis cinerea T4]|uniref:Uncharacterized protein n=1 Tax=Botryotinia fuckeliana (strain T4) TaxID=999810 RepID=G2XTT4_BOTF4|nr:predicted protein [Botrytis cinerea T4]
MSILDLLRVASRFPNAGTKHGMAPENSFLGHCEPLGLLRIISKGYV